MYKIVKITGCHDCPLVAYDGFSVLNSECMHSHRKTEKIVTIFEEQKKYPSDCPLEDGIEKIKEIYIERRTRTN